CLPKRRTVKRIISKLDLHHVFCPIERRKETSSQNAQSAGPVRVFYPHGSCHRRAVHQDSLRRTHTVPNRELKVHAAVVLKQLTTRTVKLARQHRIELDPIKVTPQPEQLTDDQTVIDAGPAGIDAPAGIDRHFAATKLL